MESSNIFESIGRGLLYAVFFIVPLLILPVTVFPVEWNKAFAVALAVIVASICYLIASLQKGYIIIPRHPLLLGILGLVVVTGFATIFSVAPHSSFFGIGSEPLTFFNVTIAFLAVFLVASLMYAPRHMIALMISLVVSALLASIIVLFHGVFNIRIFPWDFAVSRSFNTIGSLNTLALFLGAILVSTVPIINSMRRRFVQPLFFIFWVVFLALAIIIQSPLAWLITGIVSIILLAYNFSSRILGKSGSALLIVLIFVAFVMLIGQQQFSSFMPKIPAPIEIGPSFSSTVVVIKNIIAERPVLGWGPNTFGLAWDMWRPAQVNNTAFWAVRFDNSHSFIGNIIAGTGFLGIFALLVFLVFYVWSLVRLLVASHQVGVVMVQRMSALLTIFLLIGFFTYAGNYTLFILFMFGCALLIVSSISESSYARVAVMSSNQRSSFVIGFFMILLFGLAATALYTVSIRYAGAISFEKALRAFSAGDGDRAMSMAFRAFNFDSSQDRHSRFLAQLELTRVQAAIRSANQISAEEARANFQQHLSSAISWGQRSITINSRDVNNWRSLGNVYESVMPFVGGAGNFAYAIYGEAGKRAPNNPLFFIDRARTHMIAAEQLTLQGGAEGKSLAQQEYDAAQHELEGALALKGDLSSAYFFLAQIEIRRGNATAAIERGKQAVDTAPNDIGTLFQLGLLYYQNGQFSNARATFERAIVVNPNYANALYFLGLTYDRQGNVSQAIQMFERVARLNPGNIEVQRILVNLQGDRSALSGIVPPAEAPEDRPVPPIFEGERE